MLRARISASGLDSLARGLEEEVAGYMTAAMRDTTDEVKEAFRAQVRSAGLGERLANAVRGVA